MCAMVMPDSGSEKKKTTGVFLVGNATYTDTFNLISSHCLDSRLAPVTFSLKKKSCFVVVLV